MIHLPQVIGLTLCKGLEVNPSKGTISLVGLFHQLVFDQFPSPPQQFTVYALLYDGLGEGRITVDVARLFPEQDVDHYERWLGFPGRKKFVNLEVPLRRCVFIAPGVYAITLRFEDELLSSRTIEIKRKPH